MQPSGLGLGLRLWLCGMHFDDGVGSGRAAKVPFGPHRYVSDIVFRSHSIPAPWSRQRREYRSMKMLAILQIARQIGRTYGYVPCISVLIGFCYDGRCRSRENFGKASSTIRVEILQREWSSDHRVDRSLHRVQSIRAKRHHNITVTPNLEFIKSFVTSRSTQMHGGAPDQQKSFR